MHLSYCHITSKDAVNNNNQKYEQQSCIQTAIKYNKIQLVHVYANNKFLMLMLI